MLRVIFISIAALLTGASFWYASFNAARAHELKTQMTDAMNTIHALKTNLEQSQQRIDYLNQENLRISDRANRFGSTKTEPLTSPEPLATNAEALTESPDAEETKMDSQTEPNPSRWENRRREFAAQAENRHNQWMEYMDARWENADPDTQERITALAEYQNSLLDIREQMRIAESDEARSELREAMRETFRGIQQITEDQQNAMLYNVATEYGITKPEDKTAFTNAVREIIADPLFQFGLPGRGSRFSSPRDWRSPRE